MFDFLHILSHELGTAISVWAAMTAVLAAGAAGFLNVMKENEGVDINSLNV